MSSRRNKAATILYKCGVSSILVFLAIIMAFGAVKGTYNRQRISALEHLFRNERPRAMVDTWSVPPKAVLQSFPPSQTVFGTFEPRPRWLREILGIKIVCARLAGPNANDSDLDALAHFEELEYLEIIDAAVTDSAIDKLRTAIPDCQIVRE
jgi:hypothetical protein